MNKKLINESKYKYSDKKLFYKNKGFLFYCKILFLLILFFSPSKIYASEKKSINIYINQNEILDKNEHGVNIYIFSDGQIDTDKTGNTFIFFSNLKINSNLKNRAYVLFSDITLNEGSGEVIRTLSSKITKNKTFGNVLISSYLKYIPFIEKTIETETNTVYEDVVPFELLILIVIMIKVFICFSLLALKKSIFIQGFEAIRHEFLLTLRNGLASYFTMVSMVFLFSISVIGVPISILFILIYSIFTILGETILGIFIGNQITKRTNFESNLFADMIIGVTILEIPGFISYITVIYNFILLPVICSGIILTVLINWFVRKRFYESQYDDDREKTPADVRSIILKNIDKT